MALQGQIPMDFGLVFPHGAVATGVEQQLDFETKRPEKDKETGLPVWLVDVYDLDPDAKHKQSAMRVRVLAERCPTLPDPVMGPMRPIEFTGMTAFPWVEVIGKDKQGEPMTRIQWSLRARGVQAPKTMGRPAGVAKDAA
jgi:hypothetical protein